MLSNLCDSKFWVRCWVTLLFVQIRGGLDPESDFASSSLLLEPLEECSHFRMLAIRLAALLLVASQVQLQPCQHDRHCKLNCSLHVRMSPAVPGSLQGQPAGQRGTCDPVQECCQVPNLPDLI